MVSMRIWFVFICEVKVFIPLRVITVIELSATTTSVVIVSVQHELL
jgi:hypothetical protein